MADVEPRCIKQFRSLTGKASLSKKDHCQWSLHAAEGNRIRLDFVDFSFSNNDSSCTDDFIEILNGLTEYAPVLAKFCSGKNPYQITSTGRHLIIRYVMSGRVRTNFQLNYLEIGSKKSDSDFDINRGKIQGCPVLT